MTKPAAAGPERDTLAACASTDHLGAPCTQLAGRYGNRDRAARLVPRAAFHGALSAAGDRTRGRRSSASDTGTAPADLRGCDPSLAPIIRTGESEAAEAPKRTIRSSPGRRTGARRLLR